MKACHRSPKHKVPTNGSLWNKNEHISLSFSRCPNQLQHAWWALEHSGSSARFTGPFKRKPVQVKKRAGSLNLCWNIWKCQKLDTTTHRPSNQSFLRDSFSRWGKGFSNRPQVGVCATSAASSRNRGKPPPISLWKPRASPPPPNYFKSLSMLTYRSNTVRVSVGVCEPRSSH